MCGLRTHPRAYICWEHRNLEIASMWEISKAKHFIEKYEVRLKFLEGWKGSTPKKTFMGRAYNFQTTRNINNFPQRNTIQFQHPFQLVHDTYSSLLMVKVSKKVPENENCWKIEMSNIKWLRSDLRSVCKLQYNVQLHYKSLFSWHLSHW